ncbi:uncharacterized protein A4U43_C07F25050 [Asparagus officinalis]|uniref:Homeobox domain-containing protein n=1 Tax=Asparagus officinalis TaxID=4686 RepID=A0A5P1EEQ0_ASPOF|nr:BEL1-like homeodomain protein 7 isoform X2 [Asparagus officinalis]ONK64365.1 uncharacterized protein A4U43_C07F25050 [Asparagus officinalis]
MATFYPTNQRDLMTIPESSVGGNMMCFNFVSSGPFSEMLAGSNESQTNCNSFPVILQEYSWRHNSNEMSVMQANNGSMEGEDDLIQRSVIFNGQALSNFSKMQRQELSLSLGSQIPISNSDISMLNSHQSSENGDSCRDDTRNKHFHANSSTYALTNLASNISNSKYLKAAQKLLDEVVNVHNGLIQKESKKQSYNASAVCKDTDGLLKSDGIPANPQESTVNSSSDLSSSERQDLQNKVTKLLAILDEVDRRYKQYYHQMQIIVSSFNVMAGSCAAKPYTALALQTISRHFCCLRDAINDQIHSTRKTIGDQESPSTKGCGISRLRHIDQHLRQERATQKFGMMQPHAWRPKRGLPETSVSALRAWIFEHFLHPYPNDTEKLMLAKDTGLTKSQVSNWFINARVRLWKPMIEEMYKEEFGETEVDSNSSSENPPKGRDDAFVI